ncbi:MAG: RT0821/Lpp0805 family surface protein [Pseudomonadota bacterium]|nr:RT0821/Lpp0805 family surface protein [Pseudomonadota bacterium]
MKTLAHAFMFAIIATTTVGCSSKQDTGKLLGGVIGGVLGSNIGSGTGQTAAIIGGSMIGSLFGDSIGSSLDKADRAYLYRAQQTAYSTPMGHQINWHNPKSGHSGSVLPVREGTSARGEYCREFEQKIYISGQPHNAYGTACQQPDGSWRVVQ